MTAGFFLEQDAIADFPAKEYAGLQYATSDEIQSIQTVLFLKHLSNAVETSPFYKKCYKEACVDLKAVQTLEDIRKLPFTTKDDLAHTEPFLATDPSNIVDVCLTSGTSGAKPTIISLTQSDLARLAYNEELAFSIAGITPEDTVLVCAAVDRCFMAGIAYFMGGVKLGARMLRSGAGTPAQQWELINLAGATVMVGVPSLMAKIGQYALDNHHDPVKTSVRKLVAIGEPTRDEDLELLPVSRQLEEMWGAKIHSTYASSELATTFCECEARAGGHERPELNVIEILDEDGNPVPDGEKGEVVTTPLGVQAMPLIRFKTGDISYIIKEKCSCGRTTRRLAPILGRKNQLLKYKGTSVFPNAILSSLEGDPRFHGGYVEAHKNPDGTDRVLLYAALSDERIKDAGSKGSGSGDTWIRECLQAKVRVVPEIKIVTPQQADEKVYQFDKKRKRMTFFDLR